MSEHPVTADEALDAAHEFLGDDYVEKGVNRGVFRSADGLRQFRMDPDSIQENTGPTFHTYTSRFSLSPEPRRRR
ncbi:hypothetical protein LMJ41_18655 [Streptomyces globisporus]|nr:hypothetical protein [Streptomyces globisporus]